MPGMGAGWFGASLKAGSSRVFGQFLTSMIAHQGDHFASLEDIFSPEGLRRLGIAMASAGLADKLGGHFGVDLTPPKKP